MRDLSRSRELRELHGDTGLRWYSNQAHDDAYALDAKTRKRTVSAVRRYVAAERMPRQRADELLRKVTVELLVSRDARLARSALRDLSAPARPPWITADDVPVVLPVARNDGAAIDVRVGILKELPRRGLLQGSSEWIYLLESTRGADRLAAIRAAGLASDPEVDATLVELLRGPVSDECRAAAIALGRPGNSPAVEPL